MEKSQIIHIDRVLPNQNQPRKYFDSEAMKDLKKSIEKSGIVEPIIVRPLKSGYYETVIGERRLRAAKELGLDKIPCIVREIDENEAFLQAITENIVREDLGCIEEAHAYDEMIKRGIVKNKVQVSEKLGISKARVTQIMNILNLPENIQDEMLTRVNIFSEGHARHLLRVQNSDLQLKLFQKTIDNTWSVRELERKVKNILEPSTRKKQKTTKGFKYETEGFKLKIDMEALSKEQVINILKNIISEIEKS